MNTFDKVKSVIVESLNCDEALVTPEARLVEDLGADSLDAVELIMAMEEACNMTFEDADSGRHRLLHRRPSIKGKRMTRAERLWFFSYQIDLKFKIIFCRSGCESRGWRDQARQP